MAVTFTKKAAGEMERRLTELLSAATAQEGGDAPSPEASVGIAVEDEDDFLEQGEYVDYGNAEPHGDAARADDGGAARRLLRHATVGTFHSVCSKILRRHGAELGELPSVRDCVGDARTTNAQEGADAAVPGGKGAAEPGAGNGNGRNLLPWQTLDGSFNILDQADQLRLLKEVLKEKNIVLKAPEGTSFGGKANDIRPITVLNAISLLNVHEAQQITSPGGGDDGDIAKKVSRKVLKIAHEVRVPFQRAKYSQNAVDFDDLILLTRELLLRHPDVRAALHRRHRHVLVDEFQGEISGCCCCERPTLLRLLNCVCTNSKDTSQVQLELVRLLTTDSLFVVGDGDQSIYSWRGASPESMSDFERAFHQRRHGWEGLLPHGDGAEEEGLASYLRRVCGEERPSGRDEEPLCVKSVYLMENYRSTTNIVKAAQRIISTGDRKTGGRDATASAAASRASAQDDLRRDMKPMRGAGPSPRVLACRDAKSEATFVVKTTNGMVDAGDLSPSSTVAVIYRTNAQSRLLEEACVAHNLRYVVRGSSGTFYRRAEIQDCLSFLKILNNPRDRSAWARAVKAPSRGIGPTALNEFFAYCDAVAEKQSVAASSREELSNPLEVLISLDPVDGKDDAIGTLISPRDVMSTRSINRFIPFAESLSSVQKKAEEESLSDFLLSLIEDLGLKGECYVFLVSRQTLLCGRIQHSSLVSFSGFFFPKP